jgi:GlpG protein
MAQRWAGIQTQIPVTAVLILLSILVAVDTRLGENRDANARFQFAEYHIDEVANQISYDSIWGVFAKRQYYRWIAPIFLHFGPLHLLFNMSATLSFGRAIEQRSGSWRFLGIVLVIALVSNFSQFLHSGPMFGGMSGVDFGFLWMKSRFAADYGVGMDRDFVIRFFLFAVMCLFGLFGPIANTAHFSGLFTGMALAMIPLVPRMWRRYVSQRS